MGRPARFQDTIPECAGELNRNAGLIRISQRPYRGAAPFHFTNVSPCGTRCENTYAYSITMTPTTDPSATECQATKRKIVPSLPTCSVAAVAMVIDCASTILPITPPALLAAHINTGSMPNCCEVIRCRLPKSAFEDVSLPVSA